MNTQTLIPIERQLDIHSFTSLRRVLLVGPCNLLAKSIARLINIRQSLEIIHCEDCDMNNLGIQVAQYEPDVIILCHIDPTQQHRVVAMLDYIPLSEQPLIITVDPLNPELDVYHHSHWFKANHLDFLTLVFDEIPGLLPPLVRGTA